MKISIFSSVIISVLCITEISIAQTMATGMAQDQTLAGKLLEPNFSKSNWDSCERRRSVQICKRKTQMPKAREAFSQFIVDAPPKDVLVFFREIESYCDWIDQCKQIQVIEHAQDGSIVYAVQYHTPLGDRKAITAARIVRMGGDTFYLIGEEAGSNVKTSLSGMQSKLSIGAWRIRPYDDDKTEITGYFANNPGVIPLWLVQSYLLSSVEKTSKNIIKHFQSKP